MLHFQKNIVVEIQFFAKKPLEEDILLSSAASSCSSTVVHISAASNNGAHANAVPRDCHNGLNLWQREDLRVAMDIIDF